MEFGGTLDEHDLEIAGAIQRALLPSTCPECARSHIAAGHRMQNTVGGDFYDFPYAGDGKIGLLIGDVMGHGVSASLIMAMIVGLLRREARTAADPLAAARLVNDHLAQIEEPVGHVITCSLFYGVIDVERRAMQFVNAGHPAPVVCNRDTCLVSGLEATCPLLGVVESEHLDKDCHHFEDEERLVLYTDGVTEAQNLAGELFGKARLHRVASDNLECSPSGLVGAILRETDRFTGAAPQFDDQSLVVVDFGPG